ncbi:Os01g0766500 [Oryza sativa Japonica Group]|uniref:Os01g0766500 protein n=2 Tax=Oryza TaxID=4527 RepID=A0A0P0V8K9_ORYSJ|nr:Os01g0766500 [Oryza sativa Japonica Group]
MEQKKGWILDGNGINKTKLVYSSQHPAEDLLVVVNGKRAGTTGMYATTRPQTRPVCGRAASRQVGGESKVLHRLCGGETAAGVKKRQMHL